MNSHHRRVRQFSLVLALAAVTVLVSSSMARAGAAVFDSARNMSSGSTPSSMVSADFNNDGKLDFATANLSGNNVTVSFGDGSGNFNLGPAYAVGASPRQVITGDFNNDTKPDLATVNFTANNFTLLLNNGSGVFTATSFTSGFQPSSLTAADFNGDNRLDIVTSNESTGTAWLSLALAGGGFDVAIVIAGPGPALRYITSGDVNNDGKADIVISNATQAPKLKTLLGNGNGTFAAPIENSMGIDGHFAAAYMTLGDFNGDTKVDVLVASFENKFYLFAGAQNGTFALTNTVVMPKSATSASIGARDINGDGKLDVFITGYQSDTLTLLYGDGLGGVSSQVNYLVTQPRDAVMGDFNGDGLPDFATVSDANSTFGILLNRGGNNYPTSTFVNTATGPIAIADLNNDGKQDLVVGTNPMNVVLGNGNGTFAAPVPYSNFPTHSDRVITDINNDGKLDIITSTSSQIFIRFNNGSGGFSSSVGLAFGAGRMAFADFNADGKVDLAVTPSSATTGVSIYQGDGLGGFLFINALTIPNSNSALLAGDINNDGKPDLVGVFGGILNTILATGPYTFALANPIGGSPSLIFLEDFNRDGKLDVIAPGSIRLGQIGGGFSATPEVQFPVIPYFAMFTADFNQDGRLDLGFAGGGQVEIKLQTSVGQFSSDLFAAGRVGGAVAGDVTGDGRPDVIFTSPGTNNTGTWYMKNLTQLNRAGRTADFDGDGKTDLSVFRPSNGTWYILRSSDNTFYGVQFGINGDRPVPGDYDGDGKTDIAVFRNGDWYLLRSSDGGFVQQHHGSTGDIPVPADYNGDGITNFAVFRPSTGYWYTSTDPLINYGAVQWGTSGDIPTPADYDGDGKADVGVFRPSGGSWYVLQSTSGFFQIQHGVNGDKPVPVDYDGDGRANIAVFRPANATWYRSTNPLTNYGAIQWGAAADVLVPGYYDGDNQADVAIFRDGTWYIFYTSTQSYSFFNFGTTGDIPIPSAFVP